MNYEDLMFLFGHNTYNRDYIRMDLDEATWLYKLIKMLKRRDGNCNIIEIGTYYGGSTILMLGAGGTVTTVDNYSSKTFKNFIGDPVESVTNTAKEFELENNLTIIKGDSRTHPNKDMKCDLLLIDGDHSYEGVKADYNHWIPTLKDNGHLLFHDSCIAREGATGVEGVMNFMKEVPHKKIFEIGSITHFIKEKE